MPNYRRWRVPGGSIFFTVNLQDRSQRLLIEHIELLRGVIAAVRKRHPFHIDAAVVLPEHLHHIWTLPPGDDDFSTRWRLIKADFSRSLPESEVCSVSRLRKGERGIWQRRFYDHILRDDRDYELHVDYIHYNPVKHGYVKRPADWPYSSIHTYIEKDILSPDWGTSGMSFDLDLG